MRSVLPLAIVFLAPVAHAEVLDTTRSVGAGRVRVSAGPEVGLASPNPIRLDVQERFGLANGFDLYLTQLVGLHRASGARFGSGLKWTALTRSRERPGIAVWGGGFFQTGQDVAGVTGRVLFDYRIGRVVPYAGADLDLWFENGVDPRLSVVGGLRLGLGAQLGLFLEVGGGLTGKTKDHLAAVGLALTI